MTPTDAVLAGLDALLPALGDVYRDIHAHPELSMQEQRTADVAAEPAALRLPRRPRRRRHRCGGAAGLIPTTALAVIHRRRSAAV